MNLKLEVGLRFAGVVPRLEPAPPGRSAKSQPIDLSCHTSQPTQIESTSGTFNASC